MKRIMIMLALFIGLVLFYSAKELRVNDPSPGTVFLAQDHSCVMNIEYQAPLSLPAAHGVCPIDGYVEKRSVSNSAFKDTFAESLMICNNFHMPVVVFNCSTMRLWNSYDVQPLEKTTTDRTEGLFRLDIGELCSRDGATSRHI
jgi:hypothetical protein